MVKAFPVLYVHRCVFTLIYVSLCVVFDCLFISLCAVVYFFSIVFCRVDATNWGDTQKIIEALQQMPLEGVRSRRDADDVRAVYRVPLGPESTAWLKKMLDLKTLLQP